MKFYPVSSRLAHSLVALAVSSALLSSTGSFAFASRSSRALQSQPNPVQVELQITSSRATASSSGVVIYWTTNASLDNLGFNVYRVTNNQRTRVNREIIPGALLTSTRPDLMRGGYSFAWLDPAGNANFSYVIESVSVSGSSQLHAAIRPVAGKSDPAIQRSDASTGIPTDTASRFEKSFPTVESQQPNVSNGAMEQQWTVAGQIALKIGIKNDGWYRVTQPQMVAAGFNPDVDIRNLRLFEGGNEVAINTNQAMGTFGSGDYIEFYGRGLDIPTTDTRIYYLIAGTTRGKRVGGELHLDGPGPTSTPIPTVTPLVSPTSPPVHGPVLSNPIFYSWPVQSLNNWSDAVRPPERSSTADQKTSDSSATRGAVPESVPPDYRLEVSAPVPSNIVAEKTSPKPARPADGSQPNPIAPVSVVVKSANGMTALAPSKPKAQTRKPSAAKRNKGKKSRRARKQLRHHALVAQGFAPTSFAYTVQRQDRINYIGNVLNGDQENWMGQVLGVNPITQNLTVTNLDITAPGSATLEFSLQGIVSPLGLSHQVNVSLNGVVVASLDFPSLDHPVGSVAVPVASLQNGVNAIKFTKTSTNEACLIDYARLTYPHTFKADADSLKFNLLGSQSLDVDGFSTPSVRLIDYTDPLSVSLFSPPSTPTANGYAITIPKSEPISKAERLLYALPEGQFAQPASLTINEPSTLNAATNQGAFLIVSHKSFIPAFTANVTPIGTSLVAQRQTRDGLSVSVVDVEDVYDEFGFGVHGPQAIKLFLQHASTHWAVPPRYLLIAGDGTLDPRNYQGAGFLDFVPTKLVDATFNETASDDWLSDFDNDGIANIPVGRLPVRTLADANLVISKIVNFTPQALAPETAMLIADDPTNYYFNFETANDEVQALLPPSMTVQRVNVRTESSPAQAKANVIAGFNAGRALVNYTGHGNVDIWASSRIFSTTDATALTNGSKLSFVVVMDCLNGYFQDPVLLSLSEALLQAPAGGAVATFASSGLTFPDGQHEMSQRLYTLIYGGPPIALGDAIKDAKNHTFDTDVRRTWIYFGDPSLIIR